MAPPAKKASTDRAKELLASPPTPSSCQQGQQQDAGSSAAAAAAAAGEGRLTAQFAALLDEAGVLSPVPQRQQEGMGAGGPRSAAAKELFAARQLSSSRQQQQQQQDVIELLDSPADAGGFQAHRRAAVLGQVVAHDDHDVVDLT
jgi:hypothetical protein